jgi:hypothetical protein
MAEVMPTQIPNWQTATLTRIPLTQAKCPLATEVIRTQQPSFRGRKNSIQRNR